MNEVSEMLARIGLFERLDFRQLLHLSLKMTKVELGIGEYLFQVGDKGDCLYIVYRGLIEIFLVDDQGERVVLNHLRSGESFGEMALLEQKGRSANAIASEPTLLYQLSAADFADCVAWWPALADNLLRDVSGKLRRSANQVQSLADSLAIANRQLQETDRFKSEFIGVINHELLTPFANIDFSFQILQRHGYDNLSEGQREEIEAVMAQTRTARNMAKNLVTYAAFVQKQGDLRVEEVRFQETVEQMAGILRPIAQNKSITFTVDIEPTLPAMQGDPERLGEAVYHLVHNAIKFMPASGNTSEKRVAVKVWTERRRLYFQVRDNGAGIPADRLDTIWEGFNQMADPLRRGQEGLGLGLTLVRYVVQAHGGQVWAKSVEGKGSDFGFELPFEELGLGLLNRGLGYF